MRPLRKIFHPHTVVRQTLEPDNQGGPALTLQDGPPSLSHPAARGGEMSPGGKTINDQVPCSGTERRRCSVSAVRPPGRDGPACGASAARASPRAQKGDRK
ncbi:hypothetical protein TNCT1_39830 [Streptomyces sp. 1-11]|nr:hypothetical protein TNCT1_39830 [Streptomyces sp. 1-11]